MSAGDLVSGEIKHTALPRKRHYYRSQGVVQATLQPMRRFVLEGENILVGVGCDKQEADSELDAALAKAGVK